MCVLTLREVRFFQKQGFFANLIIFGTGLACFVVFLVTANIEEGVVSDPPVSNPLVTGLMVYCTVCFGCGSLGLLAEIYVFLIVIFSCKKPENQEV